MERLRAVSSSLLDQSEKLPPSFRQMVQSLDQISEFTENNVVIFRVRPGVQH